MMIRPVMGGWNDLSTMKNICIHTQDDALEIARRILSSSNAGCGKICGSYETKKSLTAYGSNVCYLTAHVAGYVAK